MTAAGCALFLVAAAAGGRDPAIRLEAGGAGHVFQLVGWPQAGQLDADAASRVFSVYVAGHEDVALLGSYRVEGGVLIFAPRFPLRPGLRYRAVFRGSGEPVVATFELPKPDATPSTTVEQVYPSAARIPENQLKLYLYFSAPMSRGEAYRRVRLLDQAGRPIELAFLELDEELWDASGRRLTLLFDPGRVKRDLVPNREVGSPLREGGRYTLVVDRGWPDAEGRPLKVEHRRSFDVGAPDHDSPDPKTWRMVTPAPGALEPLVVEFPESLDRALVERVLDVTDRKGQPVAGSVRIDREETRWQFTPRQPWQPGDYSLVIGMILEDLAGNSIGHPFEVDVFERVQERISRETVSLPFTIVRRP